MLRRVSEHARKQDRAAVGGVLPGSAGDRFHLCDLSFQAPINVRALSIHDALTPPSPSMDRGTDKPHPFAGPHPFKPPRPPRVMAGYT